MQPNEKEKNNLLDATQRKRKEKQAVSAIIRESGAF